MTFDYVELFFPEGEKRGKEREGKGKKGGG